MNANLLHSSICLKIWETFKRLIASKMVTEWPWCIGQEPLTNLLRSVALIFAWFKAMCPKLHCFFDDTCLPWVNPTSLSSVAWRVVIIFIWLSTFDICMPLISVLLLIASIRKNNAIVNNIDKKGKSQKPLGKMLLHWDDDLCWDSIFMHAKQLWLDYVQSSNFTPRIPFQLGIGLFIIWELIQSNLINTDTGGSHMFKVSVLSRLKLKRQSKMSVMMNFPY